MYHVNDLEQAKNFYEGILGLKQVWRDEKEQMIGFQFPESDIELVIHIDSSLPNPEISFQVDNVEEFCKEYRRKGFKVFMEPIDVRCGKYAVLLDPDGNKLSIIDLVNFDGAPRYDLE